MKINPLLQRQAFYQEKHLALDMTRGKPCREQLDLSNPMLSLSPEDILSSDGIDCRNYGAHDGLMEAKTLLAPLVDLKPNQIIIGGNASLALMHDTLVWSLLSPLADMKKSWHEQGPVKFLCPSPGYDRHFGLTHHLGIEMIPISLTGHGPDMDLVEHLVAQDPQIKGIWCVPLYSNPTGEIYSDETILRLAHMKTRAPDFRIFWDNAYALHSLSDRDLKIKNILEACNVAGVPDRVFIFSSTSKISFAGGGLALFGASEANLDWFRTHLSFQTIGYDKLNQHRHVLFFKTFARIKAHMQLHAAILRPKFEAGHRVLTELLGQSDLASWNFPQGGYFISFNTKPFLAKRTVALALALGVKFTPAGATFPYQNDPKDSHIRIAPSMPSVPEIERAMEILAHCVKMANAHG